MRHALRDNKIEYCILHRKKSRYSPEKEEEVGSEYKQAQSFHNRSHKRKQQSHKRIILAQFHQ